MKSTGIVKNLDILGRIVIPKEIRKVLNIEERNPVKIPIEDDKIILKKYQNLQQKRL